MAVDRLLGPGEFNRVVEVFEKTKTKTEAGEAVISKNLIGKRWVKRLDGVGSQEEEGNLIAVAVATYQMWYDPAIALKASRLIITDGGVDWQVSGPAQIIDSKGRQMQLKTVLRGES
ncbi:structural protein [Cellulophaga phage phi39:1]|uniref:structural protein n=1 Tax=Cellulophaga phage phi39:1 TaxID=1327993 RepID=UPI000351B7B2|nr:structural protein [Cellulophaga phage phi39:1]AGO49130.1 structural protein [Cellulophaga phage phi39:1]